MIINAGRPELALTVRNTGDRPIQVGSHYHFAEANPLLDFDRQAAWGHRLAVPAGTSVRFEPGVDREVVLVPLAGARIVPGYGAGRGSTMRAMQAVGRLDLRPRLRGAIGRRPVKARCSATRRIS